MLFFVFKARFSEDKGDIRFGLSIKFRMLGDIHLGAQARM